MKRIGTMLGGLLLCFAAEAEVAVANGYTWTYRVLNGKAIITDFTPEPSGRFVIPAALDGYPVEEIGIYDNHLAYPFSHAKGGDSSYSYRNYKSCCEIVVPDGVTSIGDLCFYDIRGWASGDRSSDYILGGSVTNIVLPSSLRKIGRRAFAGLTTLSVLRLPEGVTTVPTSALPGSEDYYTVRQVRCPTTFEGWVRDSDYFYCNNVTYFGNPPTSDLKVALSCARWKVSQKCFDAWMRAIANYSWEDGRYPLANFDGVIGCETVNPDISVTILSGGFRKGNPRIYDLVYRINTTASNAKVRAVGVVEKVIYSDWLVTGYLRPSNWIDGSSANVGDAIAANVEHKLSWKISDAELPANGSRLHVQVLARTGELLPVHVVTLPSSMKIATTSSIEYDGDKKRYYDQEYMTGVPAMKVSLNVFTDQQLKDAMLFAYAEGDDTAMPPVYDEYYSRWQVGENYGPNSWGDMDVATVRTYLAGKCGFKLLSEVESFTTNYYCSAWLSSKADRSDRWLDSSRSTETTYTVDKQAIMNRLNDALFHSKTPLMDDWGNSKLGFDPWVKFD